MSFRIAGGLLAFSGENGSDRYALPGLREADSGRYP